MAKLVLPGANYGFDAPPDSIEGLAPELAMYLRALHQMLFGSAQADGVLSTDTGGGGVGGVTTHAELDGLDADDHAQYLTVERHGEIPGNPHGTTPADIGAADPEWNARALQGVDVDPLEPTDGQVLTYNDAAQAWLPADPATDPRTLLELSVAQYNVTPNAVASAGLLLLPDNALILGVSVRNPATIPGITGYQIGTQFRRDAWGTCSNVALATNSVGGFAINSPYYTGVNVEALYFTTLTGTFNGIASITTRVFFWRMPAWD